MHVMCMCYDNIGSELEDTAKKVCVHVIRMCTCDLHVIKVYCSTRMPSIIFAIPKLQMRSCTQDMDHSSPK